jgi:hypothetical protein
VEKDVVEHIKKEFNISSAETLVTLPNPYFTLFPFWVFVLSQI